MQELSKHKLYEVESVSNFRQLLDRSAKLYPDKTAFIYKKHPKDSTYITHTYQQFQEDIAAFATQLLSLGLLRKKSCYHCTESL